jgi:hypothetical protein
VNTAKRRRRAGKVNPKARCCWVCGELGGNGATTALGYFGYKIARGEVGYAHPECLARLQEKERKEHERG